MTLATRQLADLFGAARASGATDFDAAGALVELGVDVLRAGYDPAATPPAALGWLLEGPRTNALANPRGEGNGTFPTGWINGTLAGLSCAKIGEGLERGLPYADLRFWGVATASAARMWWCGAGAVPTVAGDVWTVSEYAAIVSSAGQVPGGLSRAYVINGAQGVVVGTAYGAPPVGGRLVDGYRADTLPAAGTGATSVQVGLQIAVVLGVAYDFVLRVGAPQLELAPFASSRILPPVGTPAAASRAVDDLRMTGANFSALFGAGAPRGCLVLDLLLPQVPPVSDMGLALLAFDSNERLYLQVNAATGILSFRSRSGGVLQGSVNAVAAMAAGVPFRVGLRWQPGQIAICRDGAAPVAASCLVPGGLVWLTLGNNSVALSGPMFGRVRLARAYGYAPSDAEFQQLCTPGT